MSATAFENPMSEHFKTPCQSILKPHVRAFEKPMSATAFENPMSEHLKTPCQLQHLKNMSMHLKTPMSEHKKCGTAALLRQLSRLLISSLTTGQRLKRTHVTRDSGIRYASPTSWCLTRDAAAWKGEIMLLKWTASLPLL